MDPHVDVQLLTFIAHTEQGLAVRDSDGSFRIVHFLPGELFVMAGELLEAASDGEITGVRHAVKEANSGAARLSIMYFLNPDFTKAPYPSFVSRRPVDFLKLANVIHQRFGNPVYAVD
jgi:isopenicillin N synthase-like dioxygenase